MKTLKPSVTSNGAWPVYQAGVYYSVGDIFKTSTTPTWGYWAVTTAGIGGLEPSGAAEGDIVTSGTLTCKLTRIGSGSGGGSTSTAGIEVWTSGATYKKNDFRSYKDVIYRCVVPNSDTTFDEKKWVPQGEKDAVTYWEKDVYYYSGDVVRNNGNLYSSLENHKASATFNDDLEAGKWKLIGSDQTVIGSDGDYSQVTKLGVTAPLTESISIGITKTFCKPPVEVLKKENSAVNVNEVENKFDLAEASDFEDNDYLEFSGVVKPKTSYDYSMSLDCSVVDSDNVTQCISVTDDFIDFSEYKSVEGVSV